MDTHSITTHAGILSLPVKRRGIPLLWCLTMAVLVQLAERVDCRAGGRGFDSRGWTNTQGLKITEKWSHSLCSARGETFACLGWPSKMAVPSSVGDVKYSVPNWYFRAKYIDTQIKRIFRMWPCSGYSNKLDSAALFCMLKVFTVNCINNLIPFSFQFWIWQSEPSQSRQMWKLWYKNWY